MLDENAPRDGAADVRDGYAHNGDIDLRYRVTGPADGRPILLLLGVGMQLIMWHENLIDMLVTRGFRVARMDYRDCGESTHLHHAGRPSLMKMLTRPTKAPYTLADMAVDCRAVLDALEWESADVLGVSMGGMIGQELALRHSDRVKTLVSMSSTPSSSVGRISFRTGLALTKMQDREVRNREDAGEVLANVLRLMGSPGIDDDLNWAREAGARAYDRCYDQAGRLRQEYALMAGGDRRPRLANLRVPTLVIHGEEDPIWQPAAGRATAAAVPDARLVMISGMGHGLVPRRFWPVLVEEVQRHTTTTV